MKAKRIKILARLPDKDGVFLLVPSGLYCNPRIAKAKPGDILTVQDTWRQARFEYVRHVSLKTDSAVCSFMIKSVYGERMTIGYLHKKWNALCVVEGLGEDAFSRDEIMLIEVRDITDEKKKNKV